VAASIGPRLTIRDGVKAAAAHAGSLEIALSSASSSLTEGEVVTVGSSLIAVTGDLNIFVCELSQTGCVVLESAFLVGPHSGLVKVKEDSLELAVSTW